ncbi:hypothetical protein VTO73DRAFT_11728 [Trametes versicolor]
MQLIFPPTTPSPPPPPPSPRFVMSDDDEDIVKFTNPLSQPRPGPLYVVLGGDNPGVFQPRPPDVACGLSLDSLPVVVVCRSLKEAFKIDVLNSEIIDHLEDPDDWHELAAALGSSKAAKKIFKNGEKIYALRIAAQCGIYGGLDWRKEIFPYTKHTDAHHKGCSTFLEAMLFMIDKDDLKQKAEEAQAAALQQAMSSSRSAVRSTSRAASPVKREGSPTPSPTKPRVARAGSPLKMASMPAPPPSPSKGATISAADPLAQTRSLPLSYSTRAFPSASFSSRTPGPSRPPANVHFPEPVVSNLTSTPMSASARVPTSSSARFTHEIDETFVDGFDRLNVETAHAGREAERPTPDVLRQLIRPPAEMMLAEPGHLMPAFNMGPDVDRWLSNRHLSAADHLHFLQAFLWAPHVSDFVRLVGRPGNAELRRADGEYLYELLQEWFGDPQAQ